MTQKFWGIETRNSASRSNSAFGAWAKIEGKPVRLTVAQIEAAQRLAAAGNAGIAHKQAPMRFDLDALKSAGFLIDEDVYGVKSASSAPEIISWIEPAAAAGLPTPVTAAPVTDRHAEDESWSPWDRNQPSLPVTATRQPPRS